MIYNKRIFLLTLFLLSYQEVECQSVNVFNPYITNFTKKEYVGGIENWAGVATKEGYIYFANNEGLLKYDGYKWTIYKLPNKTIVRSVTIDTFNQRIFVGGQDEVGYFEANQTGTLDYHSIKNLLPEKFLSLEDVWDIQMDGKKVLFRSVNKLFLFEQGKITLLKLNSKNIGYAKNIANSIYYQDDSQGIFEFSKNTNRFIDGSEIFVGQHIKSILKLRKERMLFVTERKGIFEYNGKVFKNFTTSGQTNNKILSSAVVINQNLIAVGSVLKGVLFYDSLGVLLNNITKKNGLQTNAIISLVKDFNGNLWAGTTNGIDQILINSPYSILYPDGELEGSAYAVKIFNKKLFVGTNNGLFFTDWELNGTTFKPTDFKKIENSDGHVWALDVIGNDLYMGHNQGAFQIIGNKAVKISKDYIGTWRFINLPDTNLMITGTYSGLQLYRKKGKVFYFDQKISGFDESARIITKDVSNNIWVSHPYRGVYKLTLSDDYKSIVQLKNYGKKNGLPSNLSNYVVRLKNDIYVNGEIGIYKFIPNENCFVKEKNLTELIGNKLNVRRLFQDNEEVIWYANEKDCGVLLVNNLIVSKNVTKQSVPFLNGKLIGGFENIYSPDKSSVFACIDKGIILIDFKSLQEKIDLKLHFTEIEIGNTYKKLVFGGHSNQKEENIKIDYNQNSIKFSFATNQLDVTNQVKYSYLLKNHDKEWSEWTDVNHYELNNMQPGHYTFIVKAIAAYGAKTNELSYEFRINNPWYSSIYACLFYISMFVIGFRYLINYLNKKHEVDKEILIKEKELSEAKIEILENEKLQTEIDFKNRELALSTMHVLQKNETLTKLREELDQVVKQSKEPETKSNIKKVIGILSDDKRLEDDWESFAVHFDQVHTDFLKRLKAHYAQLSPKDLKLCAYLRMNMTTKDIAPLLNISVRGVEISRYRLRKKMDIDPNTNLNDYMMGY
jgi:ligand-binding sensor domain-containing protein/DNA-binding CsgD family transcriptional regulator